MVRGHRMTVAFVGTLVFVKYLVFVLLLFLPNIISGCIAGSVVGLVKKTILHCFFVFLSFSVLESGEFAALFDFLLLL